MVIAYFVILWYNPMILPLNYWMKDKEKNTLELEGLVKECLPDTKFLVEVEVNKGRYILTGYLSGKMRVNYIKIVEGDRVTIEVTPYDPKQGRIIYRHK